ncbi:MAG TPA: MmgE/PrpD family protein [Acidimicrobiales bacterium]|jgi:2-methylcitrate dehydratase PrpD|nr:MmgE/PrpD family protein [Acidimicrobiales bacterium]
MARSTKQGSPTAALADFASALRFEDVPARTVAHAKLSILDAIGCALFGATLPWVEALRTTVLAEGGAPQATLWGSTAAASSVQAALVNATAVHSFELDDVHMGGMVHPGALCLGATLALGEPARGHGRELLTAFVAGCEVGTRVGRAVGPAHFHAGFHPQGTVGVFLAAAAAGRALGLEPNVLRDALGLAGSQAGGLMAAQEGSMVKRLHSGLACQAGVRSAQLAAAGFTGIPDVLEAAFGGFCSTLGGGDVSLEALTSGLGTVWETDEIGFKPYASCAAAQSSIDVARELRDEVGDPCRVASVTVRTSTQSQVHCGWVYAPNGVTAAQMSIPFGVATMLLHGDVGAHRFTDEAIADPATVELAGRVQVLGDEAVDALGPEHRYVVRVRIETGDGRVVEGRAQDRPGGASRPLSRTDVVAKFTGLATPRVGATATAAILELVDRLEDLDDVRLLAAALSAPTG